MHFSACKFGSKTNLRNLDAKAFSIQFMHEKKKHNQTACLLKTRLLSCCCAQDELTAFIFSFCYLITCDYFLD